MVPRCRAAKAIRMRIAPAIWAIWSMPGEASGTRPGRSEVALGDQTALHRPLGQGGALLVLREVAESELLEEGPQVGLDRVDAEVQLGGDVAVGRGGGEAGAVPEGTAERDEDAALGG